MGPHFKIHTLAVHPVKRMPPRRLSAISFLRLRQARPHQASARLSALVFNQRRIWTRLNANSQANFVNGTGSSPNGSGVATVAHGSHLAPANVNPFRAGGMQVNDLTRAPLPPGYRPAAHAGTAHPVPTVSPGVFPVQPAGTSAPAPVVPAPIVPAGGTGATLAANSNGISPISNSSLVQPVQGQQPQVWQGSYETQTQPAEIATRMVPVSGNSSDSILPAATQETVPAASQGSSTNDSTNLMWRRPGS